MNITTDRGKKREGATRLYRILATESAFLIWKLRNERVIRGIESDTGKHTPVGVRNRWMSAINARLKTDIAMTRERWGPRRTHRETVLSTWNNTLRGEDNLPDDWTYTTSEVLVGIQVLECRRGRAHPPTPVDTMTAPASPTLGYPMGSRVP